MSVDQINADGHHEASLLVERLVSVAAGKAVADTRLVAARFGKDHKYLLRTVDKLAARLSRLEGTWVQKWAHGLVEKRMARPNAPGHLDRYYELDRDVFVLVVMGFTGEEAMQWKMKYIEAFNAMEAKLGLRRVEADQQTEPEAPKLTDELRIPYPDEGRYVLTISPEKTHHIYKVTFEDLMTEEDNLNIEILALAIRSIEAFWQKSQQLVSLGLDPRDGFVHRKLEGAIVQAAGLASHFLSVYGRRSYDL